MANINDVAKLAGVSRGTVSNVINDKKVKESSRIKVEKAIEELGYVPNVAARDLKKKVSSLVVFILPTIWNPFFSELAYHLQLELKKYGLKLLLCNSMDNYKFEIEYIKMAQEHKVLGIISVTYSDILPFLQSDISYVSIKHYYTEDIPCVTTDNVMGGMIAAKELFKRGCKNLLHITRGVKNDPGLNDLKKGFENYCKKNKIKYFVYDEVSTSDTFSSLVYDFITNSIKKGEVYDGIFCGTDHYVDYCMDALKGNHLKVPEDVQIIGFIGEKSHANESFKISTIQTPIKELAVTSVNMLLDSVKGILEKKLVLLPVKFSEGETTKKI